MVFWIQASNPGHTGMIDPLDASLTEAIETAFPLRAESALIVWHYCYVPLSYKYDISVIIPDVAMLLERLIHEESGSTQVQWPSNTFCAHWRMAWEDGDLSINASWTSVVGSLESRLNQLGPVQIGTRQFVAEWKQVLGNVIEALRRSGYRYENVPGMQELEQLYSNIPTPGILYELMPQ